MTSMQAWWQRPWLTTIGDILGHVTAVVVGFVMMVVGLALGVTMIMLPVGIVVGLIGVSLFISGFLSWNREKA